MDWTQAWTLFGTGANLVIADGVLVAGAPQNLIKLDTDKEAMYALFVQLKSALEAKPGVGTLPFNIVHT